MNRAIPASRTAAVTKIAISRPVDRPPPEDAVVLGVGTVTGPVLAGAVAPVDGVDGSDTLGSVVVGGLTAVGTVVVGVLAPAFGAVVALVGPFAAAGVVLVAAAAVTLGAVVKDTATPHSTAQISAADGRQSIVANRPAIVAI